MLIREVVTRNEHAAFANDVQLAWYPSHERNLPLVKMYMFTDRAAQGKTPSVAVLERLRQSLLNGGENRYILQATYGHGKSHFALALANYFGKPAECEEVRRVLANIRHAITPDRAQNFEDFRRTKEAFLVVRVRGDLPQGLHQQFVQGLEQAIEENPKTRGAKLPFWFENALIFLNSLTADEQRGAEAFLAQHKLALAELQQQVQQKEPTAHDLCHNLHCELRRFPPNFGGEASLQSVVDWAVDELCSGPSPKAGGLIVLFDEFTAFVRRYAQKWDAANDTSLQDLLNGIAGRQGKSVFLAFAHEDPEQTAQNVQRHVPLSDRRDLSKELTRLPASHRMQLYSSMETVLDAYLAQDEEALEPILDQAATAFADATDDTMQLFRPRYDEKQGWGVELFERTVTRGCFPLHPLTTGLFSNVSFAETQNQRSVLDFVLKELADKQDEPVLLQGKPNWVYANSLVNWFGAMLGDEYGAYEAARKQLGGDITPLQLDVLQAVLLFHVGQLKREGMPFERIVAHMSGCEPKQAREELESMQGRGLLRHDGVRGTYGFWPVGGGAWPVEEMLRRDAAKVQLDGSVLQQVNDGWTKIGRLLSVEQDLGGGHPQDWAAREVILTRSSFSSDAIRRLAPLFRVDRDKGVCDGVRGVLVRLVAETEDDVSFFQQNAEAMLDAALGQEPLPVVVAIPLDPRPQLLRGMQRELTLKGLAPQRRADLGGDACATVEQNNKRAIEEELGRLRNHAVYVAPQPFRAAIRERNWQEDERKVLATSYAMAYPLNPRSFFTQYKLDTPNLRKAVSTVARHLAENRVGSGWAQIQTNRVARELVSKFLQVGGQGSWSILTVSLAIQPPQAQRVKAGWDWLEKTFAPGTTSVPVKRALIALLNPPYGYDYNQLALLFGAWYGYRAHELQVTANGYPASVLDLMSGLDLPQRFIHRLCYVEDLQLTRVDATAEEARLRLTIEQVQKGTFSPAQARGTISELQAYAQGEKNSRELRRGAQSAADILQADLDLATTYLDQAKQIEDRLTAASNLDRLLPIHELITKLPKPGRVNEASWPGPVSLADQFTAAFKKVVDAECGRLEMLSRLTEYELAKQLLTDIQSRVNRVGVIEAANRVAAALQQLEARKEMLEEEGRDQGLVSELQHMTANRGLAELRGYIERLRHVAPTSEKARSAVEKKRSEIAVEAARLEAWPSQLEEKLTQITSHPALRDFGRDLGQKLHRLDSTPEAARLTAVSEKLGQLEAVLQQIEAVRQQPLHTPRDVDEALKALASAHIGLSEHQAGLLETEVAKLRSRGEAKQREALSWIDQIEKDEQAGKSAGDLLGRVGNGHPFLNPEARVRVDALVVRLEQRQRDEQRERELRLKEAAIREQIQAVSTKASLRELRNNAELLGGLTPESQGAQELLSNKLQQVRAAIHKRLTELEAFRSRVDAPLTASAARALETDLVRSLDPYEGTPEGEDLTRLLARVREMEHAARQREAEEQSLRQSIKGLELQAPIARLREHLTRLHELESQDGETQHLILQKQREIDQAIQSIQAKLSAAEERLATAGSVDHIRKVRQELERQVSVCEASAEGSLLEQLLGRCETLERLFEQLRQVEAAQIDTPLTYQRLIDTICALRVSENGKLSPAQIAVIDSVLGKVESERKRKVAEAERWLEDCQKSAESGRELHQILSRLSRPPAFLADVHGARVVAIQEGIQGRLDSDALLAITTQFRQIGDPAKRAECLRALQEMAREMEQH